MDGSEQGRLLANDMKRIVKLTSRCKTMAQLSSKRKETIRLAPKGSNGEGESGCDCNEASGERLTECVLLREDPDQSNTVCNPNNLEGGRGWIMAPLLKRKLFIMQFWLSVRTTDGRSHMPKLSMSKVLCPSSSRRGILKLVWGWSMALRRTIVRGSDYG